MKLALGTAQFGLNYGISNKSGRVPLSEIKCILKHAEQSGIKLIDTAALYGESEKALGDSGCLNNFNIVTKSPTFSGIKKLKKKHSEILKQSLWNSLQLLKLEGVYGLLIHHAEDLLKEGSERLIDTLQNLQQMKWLKKIGVSVYNGKQIDEIIRRYPSIDIIQLPLNVLDQRLITSGHILELKKRNIEIHSRSVFLQGLLLMKNCELDPYFSPILSHLYDYTKAIEKYELTRLQAALLFAMQIKEIDNILIGVTSSQQLQEIIKAYEELSDKKIDFSFATLQDERFINPIMWKLSEC